MAQTNQRFALDLDEIERQLKQTQLQSPLSKSDPLAELARIVGQNDPFKTLLDADQQAGPAGRQNGDPSFVTAREQLGLSAHAYPSDDASVLQSDQGLSSSQAYVPPQASYEESPDELYPLEPRRSRRGLVTVALVLGTAIAAISGALMLRNRPVTTASGEPPPIVKAESDPLKVKPENPGGVEIPNQNAQVYERSGSDKQTRIVNREEQPIDVQQAARAAQGATSGAPPAATPGAMAAPAPNNVVASLGEPRRVRTVSVRPDGTIVSPDQTSAGPPFPAPVAPPSRPAPTRTESGPAQPSTTGAAAPATASQPVAPPAPAAPPHPDARSTTPAATATPSQPPAVARPAPPNPPNGPLSISPNAAQQPTAPQRTAAAAPSRAADANETTSAAGAFSVQLSVATSEETARAQSRALQRKYAGELGGRAPFVRSAEVNGKTVYRVRVGPMSQDDAKELCTKLKGVGGDETCFIAKN
jgi:hypothetical protein